MRRTRTGRGRRRRGNFHPGFALPFAVARDRARSLVRNTVPAQKLAILVATVAVSSRCPAWDRALTTWNAFRGISRDASARGFNAAFCGEPRAISPSASNGVQIKRRLAGETAARSRLQSDYYKDVRGKFTSLGLARGCHYASADTTCYVPSGATLFRRSLFSCRVSNLLRISRTRVSYTQYYTASRLLILHSISTQFHRCNIID